MEKTELGTLKPCVNPTLNSLPPHRRRPLQSQTYRTFARILSHCNALQTSSNRRSEDGHGDILGEVGEHNVNESFMGVESSLVQQMSAIIDGAKDAKLGEVGNRIVNDSFVEVESSLFQQMFPADETKDAPKDKGSVVLIDGNKSHLMGMSKNGIEELTQGDGVKPSNSFMVSNLSSVMKTHDELSPRIEQNVFDRSIVSEVSGAAKQPTSSWVVVETPSSKLSPRREQNVFSRPFVNEAYEAASQSTSMEVVANMPEPFRSHSEKNPDSVGDFSEGLEHQLQLKQSELEELISASGDLDLPEHDFDHEQIEEGEISGGNGVDDKAMDMLFEDDVSLKEKLDEVLVSEVDERVLVNVDDGDKGIGNYNNESSPLMDHVEGSNDIMKPGRSTREERDTNPKISRENVAQNHADRFNYNLETGWLTKHVSGVKESTLPVISSQKLAQRRQITCEDITENKGSATDPMPLQEVNVAKKRRRGPLTEEKKAKKKKKERIKRAKKNEELGVRRLKLQPLLKPKTVHYCRHYLKGRCQQGEKCNFSHDTIPETKSTPCSYFARQSCMKGDDCPFDHQLSKYPCNNWATKGSCSRGADCLFKHEVSSKNEASLVSHLPKPENNSPFPPSDFKNQVNKGGITDQQSNAKLPTKNHSIGKVSENEVLKTLERSIANVPKGISISSVSQVMSPIGNTSRHGGASPYCRADICATTSSMANPSGNVPVKPVKGINFLSSGNSPIGNSAIVKKGASGSLLAKNGLVGSSPSSGGSVKTNNEVDVSCSEVASEGNKMAMEVSPVSTPQGIKCLLVGSGTVNNASGVRQKSSCPVNVNSDHGCIQGEQNSLEGLRYSRITANESGTSLHPPWQSWNQCAGNLGGNTSSSSNGFLNKPEYVLGFAARVESQIKLDRPSGNPFSLGRQ